MAFLRPVTKSYTTRIIIRNRVNPERNALFKLYSFITDWGTNTMYGSINYFSWKRALKNQCGFSSWRHRIRCRLSVGKDTQEFIYIYSEKQFTAAIDLMAKNEVDLEFEIVHKYSEDNLLLYRSDGNCALTFIRMASSEERWKKSC